MAISKETANLTRDLNQKNRELKEAYARIKKLSGIIPICSHCKQIRDDQGIDWFFRINFRYGQFNAKFLGVNEKLLNDVY